MTQRIGILGAGVGGLALVCALRRQGVEAKVFEQAKKFGRVGADVNLTPNAVRALDGLGVGKVIRDMAARPTHRLSRTWDTGEITSQLVMSDAAEKKYGAPQLTLHRADLLAILDAATTDGAVSFGKRATSIDVSEAAARVAFEDGDVQDFDLLIGADGIHSVVRAALFGKEYPKFTGIVSYRAIVPRDKLDLPWLDAFTKWWGPDAQTQLVVFPLSQGKEIFIFATKGQDDWRQESWTQPGSVEELRASYSGFHPEAKALLEACDEVLKSALYERDPMPVWSRGAATLLGDACHPMLPFMAQGACQAIEDAVVLARCLAARPGAPAAEIFQLYEGTRRERTKTIQLSSRKNEWMKEGGNADWVYGYDAWTVPLGVAPPLG